MALDDIALPTIQTAEQVVAQFDRMARRDGGRVVLASLDGGTLRVIHRPGSDPNCAGDSCVLPSVEIQQLMAEVLERRGSKLSVEVISEPRIDPKGRAR
jgi:hypothetical protein